MPHLFTHFQLAQSVARNLVTEGHFIYGLPQSSVINRLTTFIWEEIVGNQNVIGKHLPNHGKDG